MGEPYRVPPETDLSPEEDARLTALWRGQGQDDVEIWMNLRARRLGQLRVIDLRAEDLVWLVWANWAPWVRQILREELARAGVGNDPPAP
jgi:hypothetical protein